MTSNFINWRDLLNDWDAQVMKLLRQQKKEYLTAREIEILQRETLSYPGATDEQIQAVESRLGVKLPPSYIQFLQTTNGWFQLAMDAEDGKMWNTEEITWLQKQSPDWIEGWKNGQNCTNISDEIYFVYGEAQDCINFREEYLENALAISECIDAAVYLLNPQIVNENGEWEAWFFGCKLPGANRYPSFWEMMIAEKKRVLSNLSNSLFFRAKWR